MKRNLACMLLCMLTNFLFAHDAHYEKTVLKHWNIEKEKKVIDGSFYMYKNNLVYIEDANDKVYAFPITSFSKADQAYVQHKYEHIEAINEKLIAPSTTAPTNSSTTNFNYPFWIALFLLIGIAVVVFIYLKKPRLNYLAPVLIISASAALFGFSLKALKSLQSTTAPAFIDAAFAAFKPNVHTYWDSTYFYVESKGIPTTHEMMVGISNHGWQQQVPIPQCYVGANAWPIPLNPVLAANPIPVDNIHFTRGAIAIAVNGVPIFNVHTNTGVDSYVDGQLDNFGGHCGRADDYHYHIAPLHLYGTNPTSMPIAFGLDGYAVYGSVEADGSAMQALDANHGHAYNGTYHYHGTATAPYMIANMAGVVTEDATHQLIPQAAAHPVRPGLTPLSGALITACIPNSTNNGYNVTYTRNGLTDSVVYSWNTTGQYTFKFYTNGALDSTKNYNGFVQCAVPITLGMPMQETASRFITIFPNPSNGQFNLSFKNTSEQKEVRGINVYNLQGALLYHSTTFEPVIETKNWGKGVYLLHLQLSTGDYHQKLMVQ